MSAVVIRADTRCLPLPDASAGCRHWFAPYRWRRAERWRCVKCGFVTRSYNTVDRMGQRPIHLHMSVAVRGFNTPPRRHH